MASTRAPKQWCLSKHESVNSFESWRQNLIYIISLDDNFSPFLVDGTTWLKKASANPTRGLTSDGADVPAAQRKTAAQKVNLLELMLGQIANYCPVISRNTIVKGSTSIGSIWQAIRSHFGFQLTGAHFLDLADIKLNPDERPEDLYQRLVAFVDDTLMKKDNGITHHGATCDDDEEMTATVENFVVLTWLRLINADLPRLVKQRYGTELRSRTLASMKPEISQALDSLLDELRTIDDAKVLRSAGQFSKNRPFMSASCDRDAFRQRVLPSCALCQQAGRPNNHYLSMCQYLPPEDRAYLSRARQLSVIHDDLQEVSAASTVRLISGPEIVTTQATDNISSEDSDEYALPVDISSVNEVTYEDTELASGTNATTYHADIGPPSIAQYFSSDTNLPYKAMDQIQSPSSDDNPRRHIQGIFPLNTQQKSSYVTPVSRHLFPSVTPGVGSPVRDFSLQQARPVPSRPPEGHSDLGEDGACAHR